MKLSDAEISCLKKLAERFERGNNIGGPPWENIGLTDENFRGVLKLFQDLGYIKDVMHSSGAEYGMFTVDGKVLEAARTIAEEEKKAQEKDIVELVKVTFRKHPVLGWGTVAFMGFTGLITVLNQFVSLLKNLGWMK